APPLRVCADFPIWPCSRWGLPCRRVLPPTRCALTAPFHPYQRLAALRRFAFCCTFRGLAPPRRYLAPCPLEPGLSSPNRKVRGDCLASSRRYLSSHRPPALARAARRRRQCLLPSRRGPSSMNNRRKMVIAAAGAIAVALPLLAAERLAVK